MMEVIGQVKVQIIAGRTDWEKAQASGLKPFEGEVVEDYKFQHFENWGEVTAHLDSNEALEILNEGIKRRAQQKARQDVLRKWKGQAVKGPTLVGR